MNKVGVDRESVSTLSAKAAMEPTRFNATERSSFLRIHVDQVRSLLKSGHSVEQIKSTLPEFAEQYPSLLEMLTRPGGFDENSLRLMIKMLETMGKGNASQHEASIHVGQYLLNSYVKPQLDS